MRPSKKRLNLTIREKNFLFDKLEINKLEDIDKAILLKLKEGAKKLEDKRQKKKSIFKLWDIVICVVLADLEGIEDWDDIPYFVDAHYDWIKSFLKLTGGVPSGQTYERVLSLIDSKELEDLLTDFFSSLFVPQISKRPIINIDGRVDKGSSRKETSMNKKSKPLNCLNAYCSEYGMCLATEIIDDKTNEIPTIPVILDRLNIKGTIVTWDALNTQKENVKAVIDSHGDYVVPIKGNQGNFLNDLELYFDDKKLETIMAGNTNSAYLKTNEKSHSSIITYEYFQTTDVSWYFDKDKWEKLRTIGMVKKTIVKHDETIVECRYYISSLGLDIHEFSRSIRQHWSVENKLHWHLDFTFKEDNNTTANKNALMNLQLINKFWLSVLTKVKSYYNNISLRRIRRKTFYNYEKEFVNIMCYLLLK